MEVKTLVAYIIIAITISTLQHNILFDSGQAGMTISDLSNLCITTVRFTKQLTESLELS